MRRGLAALILLLGVVPAVAQERIDLPHAITYVLTRNKELIRSALSDKAAALKIKEAETQFQVILGPDVSLTVPGAEPQLGAGLRASKMFIYGTEVGLSGIVQKESSGEEGRIRLEIQQPLFRNFGPLIHGEPIVQATSALTTTKRKFEMQKADLVVDVVQAYEDIFRLQRQIRSDEESVERMNALYRVTKAKEILGRTTRADTLRVELLRGQALARLEANRERLSSRQRDFAQLLGASPDTIFELVPTPALEFAIPDFEEAARVALENRLDYAQVIQDHQDAVRAVDIARRGLFPDLRVGLGGQRSTAGDGSWFVGLSIGTNYNPTGARITLEQSEVNRMSAAQAIEIVGLSITREVQQQVLAYERANRELEIAEQNFKQAAARSRVSRRLFALGRVDNFAVTDAEEAYLQAEGQLLMAQAEVSLSAYRLLRTMGTLLEAPEDLKPKSLQTK